MLTHAGAESLKIPEKSDNAFWAVCPSRLTALYSTVHGQMGSCLGSDRAKQLDMVAWKRLNSTLAPLMGNLNIDMYLSYKYFIWICKDVKINEAHIN